MNEFFASIEKQGGQIIGVVNLDIAVPDEPEVITSAS
jgi:hypothetical protein